MTTYAMVTKESKQLHTKTSFLKSGKIGSCILGYLWAFRLRKFLIRFLIFMKEIIDC